MTEDEIRKLRRDIAEVLFGCDLPTVAAVLAEVLRRLPKALAEIPEGRL